MAGMAAGVLGGLLLGAPVYSFANEQGEERHDHGGMGQMMSDADMRAHMKDCDEMMSGDDHEMGSMRESMGSMKMMDAGV
jgi:hypothetical protein